MASPLQFLKETRSEMKAVTWPTRRKALLYATVIVIFSLGLGYVLAGFDVFFREILKTLIIK